MYVDHRAINVVVVEHGETIWSAAAQLDADCRAGDSTHIATALGALLDGMPKCRWPKLRVDVAIGTPWSRVKLVKGIPSLRRHKEVVAMLRLNASRFVASPRPAIITGASAVSTSEYHVGIAEVGLVGAITGELSNRNLRIGQIVPAESIQLEEFAAQPIVGAEHVGNTPAGEAIAAQLAMGRAPEGLALRARDNPTLTRPEASRKRVAAAAVALLAAIVSYPVVRDYTDHTTLERSRAALRSMRLLSDSGSQEQAELGRISRDLASAARFSRHRVSTALLLGAITQALPAEATVTTLRIDTANVDMVVLSPRTAAVVDAMSEVANITAPTIMGPVSREIVGARELERATLRLHMLPDYGHAKSDFEPKRDEDQ